MELNEILLVCAALFPAIALCVYVFKKDRVEKEPMGLLLLLLALGAVSCFPAAEVEEIVLNAINDVFRPYAVYYDGVGTLSGVTYKIYNACKYFVGVGLVEELFKFGIMFFVTRKNKNFNSLFDGIIYAVFVSLGFAALENVFYVLEYGWANALMRAVMSVPGHMFFGVLMGYYYSLWHMCRKAAEMERSLKAACLLTQKAKEFSGKKYIALSLIVPVFVHGLYDYCCTIGTTLGMVLLFGLLIFLYVYCFCKIASFSKTDSYDSAYAAVMVIKKYPFLTERLAELYYNNPQTAQNSTERSQ